MCGQNSRVLSAKGLSRAWPATPPRSDAAGPTTSAPPRGLAGPFHDSRTGRRASRVTPVHIHLLLISASPCLFRWTRVGCAGWAGEERGNTHVLEGPRLSLRMWPVLTCHSGPLAQETVPRACILTCAENNSHLTLFATRVAPWPKSCVIVCHLCF